MALARQRESYKFPTDGEFERALKERDLYGLRICRQLLEGLENHDTKEMTNTSGYSIEHIMPQNERLPAKWRSMLGENWKEAQSVWLHRLGNLTLTGYNSTYSDRPFDEKKTIPGGFVYSSVRLNKFVRDQPVWTVAEITTRTEALAQWAIKVWPALSVAQSLIDEANHLEMRDLAAKRDVEKTKMSEEARSLFEKLRAPILALDTNVLELAELNSVSYHGPEFFLEVLPRRYSLTLLLALDFNEVDDPSGRAQDAAQRTFFINARHEGGVSLRIRDADAITAAIPLIRQAHAASCE